MEWSPTRSGACCHDHDGPFIGHTILDTLPGLVNHVLGRFKFSEPIRGQ